MRKRFNLILCILFTIGITSGCPLGAQTNDRVTIETISLLADSLEQAGILHNQGLDYILVAFQKEKKRLFKEEGIQITLESPSEIKERLLNVGYEAMVSFLKNAMPSVSDAEIERMINKNDFMSGNLNSVEKGKEAIQSSTSFVRENYRKLLALVNESLPDLFQLKEKIKSLEQEIKTEAPSREEAMIILSAVITVRYSVFYWSEKLKKWKSLWNPITIYAGLTPEENDAVAGMIPGAYAHPSDSTKYIMIRSDSTVSVEQCSSELVFYERMQTCLSPKAIESDKRLFQP